jgi:circadian clock protein KaiC
VLDSVSHFSRITRDPIELRQIHSTLINGLRREGVTSILTCETSVTRMRPSDKLAYIVDAILMLRYVEVNSAVRRALLVLKMRGSAHSRSIHGFEIRQEGVVVTEPFTGLEGLLTGMPTQTPRR